MIRRVSRSLALDGQSPCIEKHSKFRVPPAQGGPRASVPKNDCPSFTLRCQLKFSLELSGGHSAHDFAVDWDGKYYDARECRANCTGIFVEGYRRQNLLAGRIAAKTPGAGGIL